MKLDLSYERTIEDVLEEIQEYTEDIKLLDLLRMKSEDDDKAMNITLFHGRQKIKHWIHNNKNMTTLIDNEIEFINKEIKDLITEKEKLENIPKE